MEDLVTVIHRKLDVFIDVEKADGRKFRYWLKPDPPCPECGAKGCIDKVEDAKVNDWVRICPKCNHEFSLIEEIQGTA